MIGTMQPDLFGDAAAKPPEQAELFAEIVFDRPLDHAYTYAVPKRLEESAAVGKRLLAPFGKGEKLTVGYCVRLTRTPPARAVKIIRQVLDDEVFLTPDLLRLTRW